VKGVSDGLRGEDWLGVGNIPGVVDVQPGPRSEKIGGRQPVIEGLIVCLFREFSTNDFQNKEQGKPERFHAIIQLEGRNE
jgi:hypothetical protein